MTSKRHRAWDRELKAVWARHVASEGEYCEVCGGTFGLALAHSKKRRHISSKEDYFTVALLCQPCHEAAEHSPNMEEMILEIIKRRDRDVQ